MQALLFVVMCPTHTHTHFSISTICILYVLLLCLPFIIVVRFYLRSALGNLITNYNGCAGVTAFLCISQVAITYVYGRRIDFAGVVLH